MTELLTNRIKVRGKEYVVRELKGFEMASVRTLLGTEAKNERHRIPAYVSSIASVDPALGNELACAQLPHLVIESISTEAIRLTNSDSQEGEEGKKA
jgi:hypothetical protein